MLPGDTPDYSKDFPAASIPEHNVIKLANSLFSFLRSGEKQVTIRKGVRGYTLGHARIEPADDNGEWGPEIIFIDSLACMRVEEVPDDEARDDGFRNWKDLLAGLQDYYPDLTATDFVTIVRFKLAESSDA